MGGTTLLAVLPVLNLIVEDCGGCSMLEALDRSYDELSPANDFRVFREELDGFS
jgi:hypothetical protein